MELSTAQNAFKNIMAEVSNSVSLEFLKWIEKSWLSNSQVDKSLEESVLEEIAASLRKEIPMTGVLSSEKIHQPDDQSKEALNTTVEVDEFLYDDDMLEKLVEDGKFSRHYCVDCGSRKVKPLNLISHSCSIERMRYLFHYLLPPLENKTLLDIGSRLGAVLFGAHELSDATTIIGVELNSDWCKTAEKVVRDWKMSERVQVVVGDIRDHKELVSSADAVLVSNVFQYFAEKEVAIDCWKFLAKALKPGALLALSPRAQDTFKQYSIGFDWTKWLKEEEAFDVEAASMDEYEEFRESMAVYRVLPNAAKLVVD